AGMSAAPGEEAAPAADTPPPVPEQTADQASGRFELEGRSLREHAARGTIINTVFLVALSTLGLAKGFILAGLMTPDDYGVWGLLIVSLGTIGWLKQVGIDDRYIQQDDPDQELAFQQAFTLEALFNGMLAVLLLIAVPLMALAYGESRILWPGIALLGLLPAVTLQVPIWVLYRRMQFLRQRQLQAIDPIVSFAVAIALAAGGAGYWAWVIAALAGSWSSALVAVRTSPYPLRFRWSPGAARAYARFSGPLLVASIGGIVVAQGSVLAGQAALGLAGVGAITLATQVSAYSNRVDDIISETLYPAVCAVADRTDVLLESFVKSNRLALMWALPCGFGLALFAQPLIDYGLGERWQDAVLPLQALGVATAIGHLGFNWGGYIKATGVTRPLAVHSVWCAAFFAVAGIPLILLAGFAGFSASILGLVLASLVIRAYYLRGLFPGFRMGRHALRAITPSVLPVLGVLAVRGPGGDSLAAAVIELTAYVGLTIAVTVATERPLLAEVMGHLRSRPSVVLPAAGPSAP
ncbi:MAG: oligosaccharide flippase family protein, partial [Solirubrobacterales bacterium]|nr:oligosaccharide flippase family protein [Solirubrobacterales bacterium]